MKNFRCNRCGACCRISPWVSRKEIKKIRDLGHKEDEFLEQSPDGLFFLKMKKGMCVFLKQNEKTTSCKIYKARPVTCRLYPSALRANGNCRPEGLSSDRLFR